MYSNCSLLLVYLSTLVNYFNSNSSTILPFYIIISLHHHLYNPFIKYSLIKETLLYMLLIISIIYRIYHILLKLSTNRLSISISVDYSFPNNNNNNINNNINKNNINKKLIQVIKVI